MCQIELFNHLLWIIIISYLKPDSYEQIIYIPLEYLINRITNVNLVWVYGISTFVGYLMPNPVNTYILDIYDLLIKSL